MLDPPKIPPDVLAPVLAPLWVFLLSALGAAVGFLEDFKMEDTWQVKCVKVVTRLASSALAGVLTYRLLMAMDVSSENWRMVLVGIAGHMGVEALKALGDVWKSKIGGKP